MARKDLGTPFRQYGPVVVFATMTVIGSAVIWGGKLYDFDIALITAIPILLMLSYLLLNMLPGLRVRSEQAGDNLYYMGFIFTLASLGISLYRFTGEASIEDVVRNFGIAILSTITGIALRIFYNQMRRDPADIDAAVRLELSEMTRRVRTELDSSALEFSSYRRTSNQMLSEGFEEIARQAEKNGAAVRAAIEAMSSDATKAIEEASKKLLGTLETTHGHVAALAEKNVAVVGQTAERIDKSVGAVIERSDALCLAIEEMTTKFKEARSPDEVLRIEVAPAVDALREIVESNVSSMNDNAVAARDAAKKVLSAIAPFKGLAAELKQLAIDMKSSSAASSSSIETIESAVKSIQGAADAIREVAGLERSSNGKLDQLSVAVNALADASAKRDRDIVSRTERVEGALNRIAQSGRETPSLVGAAVEATVGDQGNGAGQPEKSRWNPWR